MRSSVIPSAAVMAVSLAFSTACNAQTAASPKASPSTAKASPAVSAEPTRVITIVIAHPGSYQLFIPGQGDVSAFPVTDKPSVTLSAVAEKPEADVIDQTKGTVAVISTSSVKNGQTITVSPADFKYVRTVSIPLTSAVGGKAVASGGVALTDSAGMTQARLLTPDDNGAVRFENVLLGKATVVASANAGGPKSTQETIIAPAKGGGAVIIPITLSGTVATLDQSAKPSPAAPEAAAAVTNASPEPAGNNWIPGVIGIAILVGGILYAVQVLKTRGVTMEDALKKMGVEMPQDGAGGTLASPLKSVATTTPLPPLPSLNDLPPAGPAAANGMGASQFGPAANGPATSVRTPPRLLGLSGAVDGEKFPLEGGSPFTVGRDELNSLALTSDNAVSRRHALVERSGDGWSIVDSGSSNGTFVNGQRVTGSQSLRSGDEIQIGGARFRFEG